MNLVKYGLGLLLLLTISCNSDDGIDLRKDKVLVKEIINDNTYFNSKNPQFPHYKEQRSFVYNKQSLISAIKTDLQYRDTWSFDPETGKFLNQIFNSKTNIIFKYKENSLLDEATSIINGKKFVKNFIYNEKNQLTTIKEEHRTTTFYYNEYGLVEQMNMTYHLDHLPDSFHFIQYHKDGNIKEVYYSTLTNSFYINYELFDVKNPFSESNINFSLSLGPMEGRPYIFSSQNTDFMENFEYVYKGDKLLKSIIMKPYIGGLSTTIEQFQILELKEDHLPTKTLRLNNTSYETTYLY